MSDANLSTVAFIKETTWGTTPATPSLKKLRLTGESLMHEKTTVLSEEIRDDRQNSDLVEVGSQASGGFEFELSYTAFQAFLEAALFSTIVTVNESATCDITAGVAADQVLTLAANVSADDVVTIDGIAYTFKATPSLPYHVDLGGSASVSIDNLIAAINAGTGAGTLYGTGTAPHPTVSAAAGAGDTMDITARVQGTAGNAITTTESSSNASWGAATLAGGVDPVIEASAGEFDNLKVGQTIKVAGSATAGNNGLKLITAKATDGSSITLAAGSLAADTSTEALTFTGKHLSNGTERHSFTMERRILNSAGHPNYQVYRGMMVDGLELTFESKAIVTGSFTFLGKAGEDGANTSLDANQAYTDSDAGDVVNATSHVGSFLLDRETTSERFKTIGLTIANNLRGKDAIGERGNFDVGVGSFEVTGTMNAYFQDKRFHQRFIEHDDLAFSFQVTDPDGNVMVFTVPRAKLGSGTPQIEAKDTDVMVATEYTAIRELASGRTLIIDFHDA